MSIHMSIQLVSALVKNNESADLNMTALILSLQQVNSQQSRHPSRGPSRHPSRQPSRGMRACMCSCVRSQAHMPQGCRVVPCRALCAVLCGQAYRHVYRHLCSHVQCMRLKMSIGMCAVQMLLIKNDHAAQARARTHACTHKDTHTHAQTGPSAIGGAQARVHWTNVLYALHSVREGVPLTPTHACAPCPRPS